jgi:hypothetical protein
MGGGEENEKNAWLSPDLGLHEVTSRDCRLHARVLVTFEALAACGESEGATTTTIAVRPRLRC